MATRIVYGLGLSLAIIAALWTDASTAVMAFLMFAIVVLGAAYAYLNIDCKAPQAFIVTALVIGVAAGADVLAHVYWVGTYLDAILDKVVVMYYAGGVCVLCMRANNILTGDGV